MRKRLVEGEVRADLPTTVRIGQYDYTIKRWNKLAADNAGCYGLCDRGTQTILVAGGMTMQHEAHVVVHEIFHAAWDTGSLREANANDEEYSVAVLSNQWSQIIRDNPDLMAYLEQAYGR